jgi:hypothetical protein
LQTALVVSVKKVHTVAPSPLLTVDRDIPPLHREHFDVEGYQVRDGQNSLARDIAGRLLDSSKPDVVALDAPCGAGKTIIASKSMSVIAAKAQEREATKGNTLCIFANMGGNYEEKQARQVGAFQSTAFTPSNASHMANLRREFVNRDAAVIVMKRRGLFSLCNGVRAPGCHLFYNLDAEDIENQDILLENMEGGKLPTLENIVSEFNIKNVVIYIDEVQFVLTQEAKNMSRLLCNQKTLSNVPWLATPFNLFVVTMSATADDFGDCPQQIFDTNRGSMYTLKIASNTISPDTADVCEAAVKITSSASYNEVAASHYDFLRGSDARFQLSCSCEKHRMRGIRDPEDSAILSEMAETAILNALMPTDRSSTGWNSTRGKYKVECMAYDYIEFNSRLPVTSEDTDKNTIYMTQAVARDIARDIVNDIDVASFLLGRTKDELNEINVCNPKQTEMRQVLSRGVVPTTKDVKHFNVLLMGVECNPMATLLRTKAAVDSINSDGRSKSIIFDLTNDNEATRAHKMNTDVVEAILSNAKQVVILTRAASVVGSEVYSAHPTCAVYIGENKKLRYQFFSRLGRVVPEVGLVIPSIDRGYMHFALTSSFGVTILPDNKGYVSTVAKLAAPHSTTFNSVKVDYQDTRTANRFARACFKLGAKANNVATPLDMLYPIKFRNYASLSDGFKGMYEERERNTPEWNGMFVRHLEYLTSNRDYSCTHATPT